MFGQMCLDYVQDTYHISLSYNGAALKVQSFMYSMCATVSMMHFSASHPSHPNNKLQRPLPKNSSNLLRAVVT